MKDMNFISIGIPFFNAEKYLEGAIKSVLAQNYQNWELILIDDGSTDLSLEIAKSFDDPRIRVISDGFNRKLPYRLNQIIDESKYDYIARMDADDFMHPLRLEKQLEFLLKNLNYDLVATSYFTIDKNNNVVDIRKIEKNDFGVHDFIRGNHFICHPTILAKKSWYLRNKYDGEFDRAEDFELWFRAITKNDFRIKILEEILFFYREDGSISKNKLLNSYKTSRMIFDKYKSYMKFKEYFIASISNQLKIFIVSAFYSSWLEKKLVSKRNYKGLEGNLKNDIQKIIEKILEI